MWLLKTEPSSYGFSHLERDRRTRWDGVRNPVAQRNLREMAVGDEVLVYHTDAERIAQTLVEKRLAACVNVLPGVLSIYRWKGAVEREMERLLVIKTTEERREETTRLLAAMHPYELPEVLALRVDAGHEPYLR